MNTVKVAVSAENIDRLTPRLALVKRLGNTNVLTKSANHIKSAVMHERLTLTEGVKLALILPSRTLIS